MIPQRPQDMPDQRNIILAVVLSIAVIAAYYFFYQKPHHDALVAQQQAELAAQQATASAGDKPAPSSTGQAPGTDLPRPAGVTPDIDAAAAGDTPLDRTAVIAEQPDRVSIDTAKLHGSINPVGGRLDDLRLVDYEVSVEDESEVPLLSPVGSKQPYYVEAGWIAHDKDTRVPGKDTRWQVVGKTDRLTTDAPVTLSLDNGEGLTFQRTISVDANYMFAFAQKVINHTDQPVTLYPYSLAARRNLPQHQHFFILHEGPLGVFNGTLTEESYGNLHKAAGENGGMVSHSFDSTGGWVGITDKYWLVGLIPQSESRMKARITYRTQRDQYQVDMLGDPVTVAPGASVDVTSHVFAGAKVVQLLDSYEQTLGITRFDLAVDFGWFYFLTKPFFYILDFLGKTLGNFGLAILVFTVMLKLLLFPLANKSYKSMSKMRQLQPRMTELRERFADDKVRLQQEMMELYKEEGVNPLSGCLPILIQIPVFFSLYKVLFVTIEMRHAPFFGWIKDLSVPDPTSLWNLFGLLPFEGPHFLVLGAWPVIMGVTMWLQMRLNPTPPDPVQKQMFALMPIVFTFMLANFPAGLVIYWSWNNTLSIVQQSVIMHRMGVANPLFQRRTYTGGGDGDS